MRFYVRNVNDPTDCYGEYDNGADAANRANGLNDHFRAANDPRRVRVCREEAPAPCAEAVATALVVDPDEMVQVLCGWPIPYRVAGTTRGWYENLRPGQSMYKLIPTSGAEWRIREMARENRHRVPWAEEPWWLGSEHFTVHFPYPSERNAAKVGFTASEDHGLADRQTVMRPGAYLKKFFGDKLTDGEIREWAIKWSNAFAPQTLLFAKTADEIQDVYENGPNSCMGYLASDYAGSIHPTRVYAGPDLQVAYIRDGDRITGRTVVWPAEKTYVRIYGDCERMEDALRLAGYVRGSIEGARLTRIDSAYGIHCPYLDYTGYVEVGDEYLTVSSSGTRADRTDGLLEPEAYSHCVFCGDALDEVSCYYEEWFEGNACEHCHDYHVSHCEGCHKNFPINDVVEAPNGRMYCTANCYGEHVGCCENCENDTMRDDMLTTPDDQNVCPDCHGELVTHCEDCRDEIMRKDAEQGRCADCAQTALELGWAPAPGAEPRP